ncbi:MAG: trypsin-like peptidase domain-containing protein [Oscillospiraceae bacterium]|nr:trypsin-like peptidase domain-containing protein [Oscillospiraceae bacterium]
MYNDNEFDGSAYPRSEDVHEPKYDTNYYDTIYRDIENNTMDLHDGGYDEPREGQSYHNRFYQERTRRVPRAKPKEKKERSHVSKARGALKAAGIVALCAIFSIASGIGTFLYMDHQYGNTAGSNKNVVIGSSVTTADTSGSTAATLDSNGLSASQIYDMACDQVVGISSSGTTTNVFGQTSSYATAGSGFIISEDGYIMTNYHVIEYAALYGADLKVLLHNGDEYSAEIVGYYQDNDIAIIKIDATGIKPVTFGNSDTMVVGQTVYCVGNPLGELDFSMSSGIISAFDRIITTEKSTSVNMFQFDAAVNSGNSGGPVYDSNGNVLGVVTAKYKDSGVEGLGFAIPINDATKIASDLIAYGSVSEAYLGVVVSDVSSDASKYGSPMGAYIDSVTEGLAAEKAGLQAGDIITAIDGTAVKSVSELKVQLKHYNGGDTVTVSVYRTGDHNSMDLQVTLDDKALVTAAGNEAANPEQQQQQNTMPNQQQNTIPDQFSGDGSQNPFYYYYYNGGDGSSENGAMPSPFNP